MRRQEDPLPYTRERLLRRGRAPDADADAQTQAQTQTQTQTRVEKRQARDADMQPIYMGMQMPGLQTK